MIFLINSRIFFNSLPFEAFLDFDVNSAVANERRVSLTQKGKAVSGALFIDNKARKKRQNSNGF